MNRNIVHVYPCDEEELHNYEGPYCPCSPKFERDDDANLLVIHAEMLKLSTIAVMKLEPIY